MTMTATAELKGRADSLFLRKRLTAFGLPVLLLIYLTYIFFSFDILGLSERADLENGRTLIRDSYSYKTHVTRDNRNGDITIAVEGERKGTYAAGTAPSWVKLGDDTVVNLGDGHVVTFGFPPG